MLCGEEIEHILIVSYIVMSHIVFIYHHIVINYHKFMFLRVSPILSE
jgi:hypothetical protein